MTSMAEAKQADDLDIICYDLVPASKVPDDCLIMKWQRRRILHKMEKSEAVSFDY